MIEGRSAIPMESEFDLKESEGHNAPSLPVLRNLNYVNQLGSHLDLTWNRNAHHLSEKKHPKSPRTWYCLSEKRKQRKLDRKRNRLYPWHVLPTELSSSHETYSEYHTYQYHIAHLISWGPFGKGILAAMIWMCLSRAIQGWLSLRFFTLGKTNLWWSTCSGNEWANILRWVLHK